MRIKDKIREELNRVTSELLDTLTKISPEIFFLKPEENSWSIGEITNHLIKIETLTYQVIQNARLSTTHRKPDEKIKYIRDTLLNFDKKLSAGGPILPDQHIHSKDELINNLKEIRKSLIDFIPNNDLSFRCEIFEHNLFGKLTRIEWLYYVVYHSERHLNQIKKVKETLITK
jgi:hypothetical protein